MRLIKIFIISFCIIMLSTNIYALDEMVNIATDWETTGKAHTAGTIDTHNLKKVSAQIYDILLSIATVAALIVGSVLGVLYMTAGINKKVEVKESLFPYIISCIVVFGSLGIWKLVVTVMGQV